MLQAPQKPLTLEAFLELPETKPASEYINGEIIQKPMPQGKHSILQRELSFVLTATFRVDKTAQAFLELRCTFGGRSIVPNITVFLANRIPRESNGDVANVFNLHSDWMIEKIIYFRDKGSVGWTKGHNPRSSWPNKTGQI